MKTTKHFTEKELQSLRHKLNQSQKVQIYVIKEKQDFTYNGYEIENKKFKISQKFGEFIGGLTELVYPDLKSDGLYRIEISYSEENGYLVGYEKVKKVA